MKKTLTLIAAAILSMMVQGQASAETQAIINFDFYSPEDAYKEIGLAGTIGSETEQTWNMLENTVIRGKDQTYGSLNEVYDSNGNLITGASVSWTSAGGTFNSNPTAFVSTDYKKLMDYYDFATVDTPGTITLSGLSNGTYTLYVYTQDEKYTGQVDGNGNHHGGVQKLDISVAGQTGSATSDPNASTFTENQNYIVISDIEVTDGSMNINYSAGLPFSSTLEQGGLGIINGFQLEQTDLGGQGNIVPEPASVILIGVGAALSRVIALRKKYVQG